MTNTPRRSERSDRGAPAGVRERSWDAALDRLASAYRTAIAVGGNQQLERDVA